MWENSEKLVLRETSFKAQLCAGFHVPFEAVERMIKMKKQERLLEVKQKILETLRDPAYRSRPLPQLMTFLEETDQELFSAAAQALLNEGYAITTKKGKLAYPETHGYVRGIYDSAAAGFGFVLPEDTTYGAKTFVPGRYNMGAMQGDTVLARVTCAPSRGKNAEGEIIKIIERAVQDVCGTFVKEDANEYIVPDEKRMGHEIQVMKGKTGGAQVGDKVLLRITIYPKDGRPAKGEVLEILGEAQSLGANYKAVLHRYGVRMEFPSAVKEQAQSLFAKGVTEEDFKGRLDFRDKKVFTIDGADAKDFDDAISLEVQPNGLKRLGVHIADVSHYVTPRSPLDEEALERGTSIYFTDKVVPMLPEALSNELCSLKPNADRLAMSVFMDVDEDGKVQAYTMHKAVIRSCKRCVYDELNDVLGGAPAGKYEDILPELREMEALYGALTKAREKRGAVDFETVESVVHLDEKGFPFEILPRERGITQKMIEEFMLLANETVAKHIETADKPCIYRIHDRPSGEKAAGLISVSAALGFPVHTGRDGIRPKDLQAVTRLIEGTPYQRILSTMMLRAMAKAKYSPDCSGHFGLALRYYCHFTSPIRRYPDLVVHRVLGLMLEKKMTGKVERAMAAFVPQASVTASERELVAQHAERDIDDLYKVLYMSDKVGQEFEGVVVSVTSFGLFVGLPNTVEGLVHISELDDDFYEFDDERLTLRGCRHRKQYQIGDVLKVTLTRTDIITRQIDFTLADE